LKLPEPLILIYGNDQNEVNRLEKIISKWKTEIHICEQKSKFTSCLSHDVFDLVFIMLKQNKKEIHELVSLIYENNPAASVCLISNLPELKDCNADYQCGYTELNNKRYFSCIFRHARQKKHQAELSAMLIHDLRSPLQSLMSYLELIDNEVFGEINAGQRKMISHALSLSEDMGEMLEGLSKIYQYEQKSFLFSREKMHLKKLFDMALPALWVLADKKNIKFSPQIISELPFVDIDIHAIYRVMVNLVTNAINHSPENSIVRLNVQMIEKKEQSEMIQFKVIDSGEGIPAEQMKHIFDKFYRIKEKASKKGGYGLGLYISKLIIDAHDGKIGAYNNREGGMTFYFTLPVNI